MPVLSRSHFSSSSALFLPIYIDLFDVWTGRPCGGQWTIDTHVFVLAAGRQRRYLPKMAGGSLVEKQALSWPRLICHFNPFAFNNRQAAKVAPVVKWRFAAGLKKRERTVAGYWPFICHQLPLFVIRCQQFLFGCLVSAQQALFIGPLSFPSTSSAC